MTPFTADLVGWYRLNARTLPWRETRDPYRIWVSEIMLQQTQVDTVIPYYHRFLDRFPTVQDLAEAPTDDVLKAWEGLGYYSRGRNLQRAAQEIVALYGGQVPDDPVALRALPGIGDYTVGAIASIAFGRPVPAVDGNVLRVVSRIAAWDHDIAKPAAKATVASWVGERFPAEAAGDFTQALMELGATVCTPANPGCQRCPVSEHCQALAQGRVATLPVKSSKAPPRPERSLVGIIWDGEQVLVQRRPATGLLAGMWEFPTILAEPGEPAEAQLERRLAESQGVTVRMTSPLTSVQHTFSHIRMTYDAYSGRLQGERAAVTDDRRWVTLAELDGLAFSKAQLKLIAVVRSQTLLSVL
jgi:A/G-specific adenine glycosylase